MGYERFDAMIAPARAGAALWRTVLGAAVSVTLYIALLLGMVRLLEAALPAADAQRLIARFVEGDSPGGALMLLYSFAFMAIGPVLLARPLHLRGWRSYIGPSGQATWDFLLSVRALILLSVALWILLPAAFTLEPNLPRGRWIALLPLTVLAVFVQASAEELVFRGYLQTQLAARFRSPLVWMLLPSALFALGHYSPEDAGDNALAFTGLSFIFGLAAADLTARTGSLGAAMGFHFANNFIALAVTALPGPLSGLALFTYPFAADDAGALAPLLWIDLAVIALSWLATRLALRV